MQVKSIAECSKGSILQYFRPSLSYHLSLKSLFCLVLSGRLRHVLRSPSVTQQSGTGQQQHYGVTTVMWWSVIVHRVLQQSGSG